jgi:6-pyruvoyltetrahydropterin/6-carboxytetrahydropterin synthase
MTMSYAVTRVIHFCYGHRLLDYAGKCRHPHGHNGVLEITISSDRLDSLGMVVDFDVIKNKIQIWVDTELDHKMILNEQDPLIPVLKEMGDPVVVLKSNPTAENIAKYIFDYAQSRGLAVYKVKLWETHNSFAEYSKE